MRKNLQELEALASMVLDAELARLDQASRELSARKDAVTALDDARAARATALREDGAAADPAFLTGQDARWSDWLAAKRARLMLDIAESAAGREAQRLRAQRAYRKRDALRQLREREVRSLQQTWARRDV
jgi:hypothetical protein